MLRSNTCLVGMTEAQILGARFSLFLYSPCLQLQEKNPFLSES